MELRFYPYDFDYKIKGENTYLYLYSKLEDGTKICVLQKYQAYFYAKIHQTDEEQAEKMLKSLEIETKTGIAKVTGWEKVKKELLGREEQFYKIYANYPKSVPVLSKELEDLGLECFEKDILFVHRYLRDNDITPMTLVKATGEFNQQIEKNLRVPVFLATHVEDETKESLEKFKILAIDIETYNREKIINPDKNPILMIALYAINEKDEILKKVLTWKKFSHDLDYVEHVSDEIELLRRFREIVYNYQPDIITGYFSDGFDLPYIKIRADKYKIKLDFALDRSELESGKKAEFKDGKSRIEGILHLDIFKFIKYIFGGNLNTESYSLNAVAKELLEHSKNDVDIANLAEVWDNDTEKLVEFCEYNLQDAYLALELCRKMMPDMIEFTKIVGLPTYDIIRMSFSRLVESYILKRAVEHNVIAPNKPSRYEIDQRMEESYEGGYVYEPVPGVYENIVVLDFRSLYPSIITSHHIGPETLGCGCCQDLDEAKTPTENTWFCTKEKKFISSILERIILRRIDLKRLIKQTDKDKKILEARSYALKILANSFYGYLGFYGARWYCLACVKAITAHARNYIKETIAKAEEKGFEVCYGDTDSCFLLLNEKSLDDVKEFMGEINKTLPGQMELEFEGFFPRGLFVGIKGTDKGAKKKYALISKEGEIKITGFETVRRNWSPIAKEVQEEVLQLVLEDKVPEALSYVKEIIKKVKEGKMEIKKLVIKTQISKELSSYTTIGPHVAVGLKMLERGIPVIPGTVVEYVICEGEGKIRDKAKLVEEAKEYDVNYYINNQIVPAVVSIFTVLGYNESDLVSESTQEGLGKFF